MNLTAHVRYGKKAIDSLSGPVLIDAASMVTVELVLKNHRKKDVEVSTESFPAHRCEEELRELKNYYGPVSVERYDPEDDD